MEEINAARVKLDVWAPAPVEVVAPDPSWTKSYAVARERICAALGQRALRVEHVGSTAVPGLWAKPMIDIDLTVADSADEGSWLPDLEAVGFVLRVREPDWEEHRLVRGQAPTSNVHVFSAGAREPRRHLLFRDWLRSHPDDRDQYSAVKCDVAARGFTDAMLYNNAKAGFVYDLYEKVFANDPDFRHDPHPRPGDIYPITGEGGRTAYVDAEPPEHYLAADAIIQTDHPEVIALGRELREGRPGDTEFARAAYEWVRDNIAHPYDVQDHRVTLTASQVLTEGVGLCYAKSNLLAAILRSQGIPAGLCYQRLGDPDEGHVVHGLVAVHLDGAWHRQDARGNKAGIDAQFSLGKEQLAYVINENKGERDYPRLYVSAADEVVDALGEATDVLACPLPSDLSAG